MIYFFIRKVLLGAGFDTSKTFYHHAAGIFYIKNNLLILCIRIHEFITEAEAVVRGRKVM